MWLGMWLDPGYVAAAGSWVLGMWLDPGYVYVAVQLCGVE